RSPARTRRGMWICSSTTVGFSATCAASSSPARREAIEDDGEHPGCHLFAEVLVGGGPGYADQQSVDLGQSGIVAYDASLLGSRGRAAKGARQCGWGLGALAAVTTAGVKQGLGYANLRRRVGDQVAEEAEECRARVGRVEQCSGLLAQAIEPPGKNGLQQC